MAVIAMRLKDAGISVNPVSGYYHDHLFVPEEKAREAVTILEELAGEARRGQGGDEEGMRRGRGGDEGGKVRREK